MPEIVTNLYVEGWHWPSSAFGRNSTEIQKETKVGKLGSKFRGNLKREGMGVTKNNFTQ